MILLCCAASLVGSNFIDDDGRVFGIKVALIVDAVMLAMGIWFLIGWLRESAEFTAVKAVKEPR